jgi:hypothetical protein
MAEVKVKVTAQNETRTGFQQALNDAKQFGNEATRSVTIDDEAALAPLRKIQQQLRDVQASARAPIEEPSSSSGGDDLASTSARGSAAIRGLATDLASATTGGQVFEAIIKRISTAMGGLVAATAGFAIGSIIRRTLEDAAAGLNALIDQSQALQQSFSDLSAPTTTFDQLASKIRGASGEIEALEEANRKLQSGIGFQLADYVNSFDLSSAANRETEQGTQNARQGLAVAIQAAAARELQLAEARTEEERKLIALTAQREELLASARRVSPEAEKQLRGLFSSQDGRADQDRERSLQAQADKQRAINEENLRSTEERLAREKQGLADLQQFGGAGVDLLREQATARIRDLEREIAAEKERAAAIAEREAEQREQAARRAAQSLASAIEEREFAGLSPAEKQAKIAADQAALISSLESGAIGPADAAQRVLELARREDALASATSGFAGSEGASAFQRVGLASNEFFDTRTKKDPADETRRAAEFVKQILDIIKKGEPLVLPGTSS